MTNLSRVVSEDPTPVGIHFFQSKKEKYGSTKMNMLFPADYSLLHI